MTHPRRSLNERIARGGAWMLGQQVSQQLLVLARYVVLARLIAPKEFGVLGMATLAVTILSALTETGLHQAIIQRRSLTERTLDSAWSALAVRGLVLALMLFAGAGVVAGFFGEPRAAPVLRALSVAVLLDGLVSVSITVLRKDLDFRGYFWFQTIGLVVEFLVTLGCALVLRNVWALAIGRIVGASTRVVVSHVLRGHWPRFVWDRQELRPLQSYGKWLTASSAFLLVLGQGDSLYVGKVFGAAALAFYQMAYRLSNLPATAISEVIALVMFPAYSAVQEQREEVALLYVRVLRLTAFLALPVGALIGALAPSFTPVLLGAKWQPIVPLVFVLALYGSLRALGATTGALFLAVGRPDIRTRIQGSQLLLFLAVLAPLTSRWHTLGVALAVTTHAIVFNLYAVYRAARLSGLGARRAARSLAGPVLGCAALVLGVTLLRRTAFVTPSIVGLAALVASGLAAYVLFFLLWDRLEGGIYRAELRRLIASVTRSREGASPRAVEP